MAIEVELRKRNNGYQWRVNEVGTGVNIARDNSRAPSSAGAMMRLWNFVQELNALKGTQLVTTHEAGGGT